jgi:hypothetical protein
MNRTSKEYDLEYLESGVWRGPTSGDGWNNVGTGKPRPMSRVCYIIHVIY